MNPILFIILLTLTPALELRASIPYGVFQTDYPLVVIFLLAVITNILLAPIVYIFLNKVVHVFLRIKAIDRCWQHVVLRAQRKVHPYVEKYGILGLAIFIGIPLPGSGVYTGALGAYLLGFSYKEFLRAAVLGVLIAGLLVTIISVSGDTAWAFLIKRV